MNRPNIDVVFKINYKIDPKGSYVYMTDHNKTLENIEKKLNQMHSFKDANDLINRIKSK